VPRPPACFEPYLRRSIREDWGSGSDVDLLLIVDRSTAPFERRAAEWDVRDLPVPADVPSIQSASGRSPTAPVLSATRSRARLSGYGRVDRSCPERGRAA
jgi:hypothetical protein